MKNKNYKTLHKRYKKRSHHSFHDWFTHTSAHTRHIRMSEFSHWIHTIILFFKYEHRAHTHCTLIAVWCFSTENLGAICRRDYIWNWRKFEEIPIIFHESLRWSMYVCGRGTTFTRTNPTSFPLYNRSQKKQTNKTNRTFCIISFERIINNHVNGCRENLFAHTANNWTHLFVTMCSTMWNFTRFAQILFLNQLLTTYTAHRHTCTYENVFSDEQSYRGTHNPSWYLCALRFFGCFSIITAIL